MLAALSARRWSAPRRSGVGVSGAALSFVCATLGCTGDSTRSATATQDTLALASPDAAAGRDALDAEPDVAAGPSYLSAPLFFEIDGVGAHPSELSGGMKQLRSRLEGLAADGVLGQTEPVAALEDDWIDGGQEYYSLDELRAIAAAHRSLPIPDGAAGAHILVVDGGFEGDTEDDFALGFAMDRDVIVVFMANVRRSVSRTKVMGKLQEAAVAGTLLLHEFGHVMGLVNDGIPMLTDHQDEEHGHHDSDPSCVMHWQADRPQLGILLGQLDGTTMGPPTFCDACRADLTAARTAP